MIYHEGRPLLKFDCSDVRVLDAMFRNAESPNKDDFSSGSHLLEWSVTMLTGPVPNMGGRLLRHRKLFGTIGVQGDGCNYMCRDWQWGFFRLREEIDADRRRLLVIDYDVISNGRILRRMRDEVRRTSDPDVMLGRFYVRMGRRGFRFLSYFALTRMG